MSKKKLAGMIVACTIAIGAGVFIVSTKVPNQPTTPGNIPNTGEFEGIKISASQLVDEYTTNEIAADQKYKSHVIALEGKVVDVSRDPRTNKPYIAVAVRGKYSGTECIRCFFDNENELLGLVKQQEVITKGKCLGKTKEESDTSLPIILENCALLEETEFEIIDWQVIVSPYNPPWPELIVRYSKFGYSLRFHLTNPSGITTSTDSVVIPGRTGYVPPTTPTEGAVHLRLTEHSYENPLPGEYRLSVEATKLLLKADPSILDTKVIATKTFDFSGPLPEVKITDTGSHWTPDMEIVIDEWSRDSPDILDNPSKAVAPSKENSHYFVNLNLSVRNTGDLPFYCTELIVNTPDFKPGESTPYPWLPSRCSIEYNRGGVRLVRKIVAPNEEEDFATVSTQYKCFVLGMVVACQDFLPVGLYFRSSGERVLNVQFEDGIGKVVYSMDTTITVP